METETLDPQQTKSTSAGVKGESAPVRSTVKKEQAVKAAPPAAKPDVAKRTDKLAFGIPQLGVTQVERQVPVSEPPPMPVNAELQYIGKPTPRYDGKAKVTGGGKYTADVKLPGMLYARMIGATVAHGKVISVDTSAAEKAPGVRGVHVIEHVLGGAQLRDPSKEIPSKFPIVRYYGQPIAAVAATSQAAANDAAQLVVVKYDAMPFVVDRHA